MAISFAGRMPDSGQRRNRLEVAGRPVRDWSQDPAREAPMRNRQTAPWTILLTLVPAGAGAALPAGAYGWMAGLAGSCWAAAYPDGTEDRQCYHSQYDRYLRGTIEIVSPGTDRPPYRGDSVFFWDPDRSEIEVHFWSDAGSHGIMTGRLDGERIVFGNPPGGGGAETRTVWTAIDAGSFRVARQRRAGDGWVDVMTLAYSRIPAG
jgi:hypothetical protein